MQTPSRELCRRGCWHLSGATILLLLIVGVASPHSTRVSTKFGLVQGLWSRSSRGRFVAHYLGIPYAEPPLGDLRFRSPQPWHRTWKYTYFATKNAAKCTQLTDNGDVEGSEDCLYLNIFVPMVSEEWDANPELPVMVYVHGGRFVSGDANSYEYAPDYLLDQDVILVTVQYRLNVFGFFSTTNKVSPGNYGFKDVLVALRWVHENIEIFHGDPNSVTLWGHSAGAAIVHGLALTNKTEGLFNRYIIQSGCIFTGGIFNSKRQIRKKSLEAASILGCLPRRTKNVTESVTDSLFNEHSTMQPQEVADNERESQGVVEEEGYSEEEDEEITRCMRSIDAEKIVRVLDHFDVWLATPCCPFGPTVEEDSDDAIFTMHPLTIIKNRLLRDIPYMIGVVKDEAAIKTAAILRDPDIQEEFKINLEYYLPLLLEYNNKLTNTSAFISAIEDFYFDGNITENLLQNITDVTNDALITWPQYQTLKYQSEVTNSSTYFYLFSYEGTFSYTFKYGSGVRYGAVHGDELNYLFPLLNRKYKGEMLHNTENDVTMINIMTEMWANFAIKGVPEAWSVPTWPEYKNSHEYLQFGMGNSPDIAVKSDFLPERMAFWEEVISNLTTDDMDPDLIIKAPTEEKKPSATDTSVSNKFDVLFSLLVLCIVCLL